MSTSAKQHQIVSAGLSLGYLVVIQIFATPVPVFRFLIPAFIGYLLVVTGYNYFYLRNKAEVSVWQVIRMPLFLLSWFGLFLLVPSSVLRGLFLLAGLPIIFMLEIFIGRVGEQLLFNEVLLTAFGGYISLMAFYQYFQITPVIYLVVVFSLSVLLCRTSYEMTPTTSAGKWGGALVISLFVTELFWALTFLPLHYSALGVIVFSCFYSVWALYYYHLFNHLTKSKVQFHLALSALCIIVISLITPWRIIN